MAVTYNAVRRSQVDQPSGVAGLDGDGYLTNIGEIGHPPQINNAGAIEAVVAHRGGTVAQLQALGALPVDEITVVKDLAGVPIGFRVGDAAATAGGRPIANGVEKASVSNLTLTSTDAITVPGLTLALPSDSLLEVGGTIRFGSGASLSYEIFVYLQQLAVLLVRDGNSAAVLGVTGVAVNLTGTGGAIVIPPTVVLTSIASDFFVTYRKLSGATNKVLTRADLYYRVIG